MYTLTCPQSGASVVVACACSQVGHNPVAAGAHHERCQMNNLTSNVACPPEAGCCPEDHDHEATANACPVSPRNGGPGHGDCPEPASCRQHAAAKAHYQATVQAHAVHREMVAAGLHPGGDHAAEALAEPPEECPGGHCHVAIEDCTVCHPVIVTAGVGTAVLRPVTA